MHKTELVIGCRDMMHHRFSPERSKDCYYGVQHRVADAPSTDCSQACPVRSGCDAMRRRRARADGSRLTALAFQKCRRERQARQAGRQKNVVPFHSAPALWTLALGSLSSWVCRVETRPLDQSSQSFLLSRIRIVPRHITPHDTSSLLPSNQTGPPPRPYSYIAWMMMMTVDGF